MDPKEEEKQPQIVNEEQNRAVAEAMRLLSMGEVFTGDQIPVCPPSPKRQ
jgi:hypothetical protein